MKRRIPTALVVAASLWVLSMPTFVDAHDPIGSKVTWTSDIARIVQARCAGCHGAGRVDTMPLTTYEEAQPWASAIRQQVLTRKMPIWHAARGFGAFANDPSLSPLEINLIAAWVNAGAPRGAGNATRPVPEASSNPSGQKPAAPSTRVVELACGSQGLSGQLVAVNPQLEKGGAATITAALPEGRREIIAWIQDYDPRYPTTYWLRTPLTLPRGSRVEIAASGGCRVTALLAL